MPGATAEITHEIVDVWSDIEVAPLSTRIERFRPSIVRDLPVCERDLAASSCSAWRSSGGPMTRMSI